MKEILVWGDISNEFKRLNISPKQTWSGYGWNEKDNMSVHKITEKEFEILCNDPQTENEWNEVECGWRWTPGSNLGCINKRFSVNGHWLKGWERKDYYGIKYKHLLEYLCDHVGASTPKNVTACTIDLARQNNMSLGELFQKYQTR